MHLLQQARYACLCIWLAALPIGTTRADDATEASPKVRVLITDGFSNHDWQLTTRLVRGILDHAGHFEIDVSTAPSAKESPAWSTWRPRFCDYDVIVQNCNSIGNGLSWPAKVQDDLEEYVRGWRPVHPPFGQQRVSGLAAIQPHDRVGLAAA